MTKIVEIIKCLNHKELQAKVNEFCKNHNVTQCPMTTIVEPEEGDTVTYHYAYIWYNDDKINQIREHLKQNGQV